jgi:hypothetical protein
LIHIYTRIRSIASPKTPPNTAPRMVCSGVPSLSEAPGTAVSVAAAGLVTVVGAVVEEARDDVVDDAVAEDDVDDETESSLIWPRRSSASSQVFSLALNIANTSSSFPPAITTMPSGPWARA